MIGEPRSVPALFLERVRESPGEVAYLFPDYGGWTSITWSDLRMDVRAVALGLAALGLGAEERCAILSSSRIEWVIADLGILCAGGATTTIYPSSTEEECAHILADSGARVCFVEDDAQAAKILACRAALPALLQVVVFDGTPTEDGWVISWSVLHAQGRALRATRPRLFEELVETIRPAALATIIYTSGTTGHPKGVELTHACWLSQSAALEATGIVDHPEPLHLFWLPFAHSFGKMMITLQLRIGFPTAIDGRVERLAENLLAIRPTIVCGVPRVFEKIRAAVLQRAREGGVLRRALARWALEVGAAGVRLDREGRSPGLVARARRALADWLVLRKVRARFGGRLRFFFSGSAPLALEVEEFFSSVGVQILEGYGLTETSAATHVNLPSRARAGTVGPALPGIEVRLAPDSEVLLRGPWVMRGYHGMPEASRDALDGEGWLHTGDIGRIDADGHLSICDRKKDLIKTAGGKYVAPQEIEGTLKALCPHLSQVLAHGDRRPYVTALVTLDPVLLRAWAAARGLSALAPEELARHSDVKVLIQDAVDRMNLKLPRFATVKRFAIVPAEFSEAAGEVTPSLKLKRKVIEARHQAVLDALYEDPGGAISGRRSASVAASPS
ncbi:AMP-dependent synthetase/ligase [Anaeromyxobacter oryzae]|uniref:AMP-dependent synthetase n=1 Tax=Anaeromyxobacter oryzae TaxID=2918170 RepID=A0ABM7WPU9_9BACT|nr:long-chain fatty acid--CoA ligase [Anaeromyxobacter oryzae]BDG01499.1 AMP-dependent synthetase [Anaeromyxobacter oryzae]